MNDKYMISKPENPSDEILIQRAGRNKNQFSYYEKFVSQFNYIYTPKTIVLEYPLFVQKKIESSGDSEVEEFYSSLVLQIRSFASSNNFSEVFIKTGLFSSKHYWDESCFVSMSNTDQQIIDKVKNICYSGLLSGAGNSFELVVRELIKCKPYFYAFSGNMPITKEFRVFADSGVVKGFQPYWPVEAFINQRVSDPLWRDRLQEMSVLENSLKMSIFEQAAKVTESIGGFWSVDFLIDENECPWLIDMATGESSYVSSLDYVSV